MADEVTYVVVGGVAVALPEGYATTREHRQFLAEIQRPGLPYAEAVSIVERYARGARGARAVAAGFLPHEDWARRFVLTTALHAESQNSSSGEKQLAVRGLKALSALLMGHQVRLGRPRLSPNGRIPGMVEICRTKIDEHWHLVKDDDRAAFCAKFQSPRVTTLMRKTKVRPIDVAYALVSDILKIPVGRVRTAMRKVDVYSR